MSRRSLFHAACGLAPIGWQLQAAEEKAAEASTAVDRLLDRVIASEQRMMKILAERNPIVETYIQEEANDSGTSKEGRDHYFLGRMVLINSVNYVSFVKRSVEPPVVTEIKPKGKLPFFKKSGTVVETKEPVAFLPVGFAQMALIDSKSFDRKAYKFDFVRREFLGDVRCLVFDVAPVAQDQPGKFLGRIWVEDQDACVVRLNGTYTLRSEEGVYFHFDSWRVNTAPGVWVPAVIYVEDTVSQKDGSGGRTAARFKGQTRIWSYDSQSKRKLEELTSMLVESEGQVKDSDARQEVSPLEGQRRWEREAETNVIERLEKIGLIAPRGEVDKILNTVVNNLIVTNELELEAQCRLLLTTPLETFTIGHTVTISRGLVDVLPDEASLALVLAMEMAHIALAHPTRTEYSFNDRTMVEDETVLDRFRFSRTPEEVASAMKKATVLLANSPYKDKLGGAGLFLKALQQKSPSLPRLIQATLGNDLTMYLKTPEFMELLAKAPSIEDSKLEQIAALPLGSRVKLEPWANQSSLMKTRSIALLSAREKMPFEVAPVNLKLTRLAATSPSKTDAAIEPGRPK
ncbi:MAG: hypothetical protein NTW74_15020 [Acidobacteria bacterium]|nr:hypothetical protein [Acidobacteriota bacterium]